MTTLSLPDYNEAYLLVLNNGCLGVGLGDCDLNYGWLEIVGLVAPDITIGEYLEFDDKKQDYQHYHCRGIRPYGRFTGYCKPYELTSLKGHELVYAPVTLKTSSYGLSSTNFQDQLIWVREHGIQKWSFTPLHNKMNGQMIMVWVFESSEHAMLFKLTWA